MPPSSLDLAEAGAVGAGVRHHRASGTSRRRPRDWRHWKNSDGVGAAGDVGERVADQSRPGPWRGCVGCQLTALVECSIRIHGAPPASTAGQVGAEGELGAGCCEGVDDVVVGADDVDRRRPTAGSRGGGSAAIVMKFVVTGTPGDSSRSTARSARRWSSSASELKRL